MKIYLDTNVIRDCLKRRRLISIRLMEVIRGKKIECTSSIFTIMELIDSEKDDMFFHNCIRKGEEITTILRKKGQRDLNPKNLSDIWNDISNLMVTYDFIEFRTLLNEGWNSGFGICRASNLDADDSLHLATAIGDKCDVLITSDSFLKKEGEKLISEVNKTSEDKSQQVFLKIMTPENALKLLEEEKKPKKKPKKKK